MNNDFLAQLDAFIFRFFGLALGAFGALALIKNNGWEKLTGNSYGIGFLLLFVAITLFSLYSIIFGDRPTSSDE